MEAKKMAKQNTEMSFEDLVGRIEKNQGIPRANVVESFRAADKEIRDVITSDLRPKAPGETLVIKTPIGGMAFKFVEKHTIKDSDGKSWEYSESIAGAGLLNRDYVNLANTGFALTRTEVK